MEHRAFTSRNGSTPLTRDALRWRVAHETIERVARAAYVAGADATELERALAAAAAANGLNAGLVAAAVLGLDAPEPRKPCFVVPSKASGRRDGARRKDLERIMVLDGIPVTDGLQTLVDLAAILDDLQWEQALESALFRRWVAIPEIEDELPRLSRSRTEGVGRIRRVLALRPPGAPPTESLLETLMVQLVRAVDAPVPTRQLVVRDEWDHFVARVDLCWPELGVFVELDGQHHPLQPVYDASRETSIVAATGWLCGRYTWTEVRRNPKPTGRKLLRVLAQAERRPLSRADIRVD